MVLPFLLFLFVEALSVNIAEKRAGLRNRILFPGHSFRSDLIDIINIACLFQAGALGPKPADGFWVCCFSHVYSTQHTIQYLQEKRECPNQQHFPFLAIALSKRNKWNIP